MHIFMKNRLVLFLVLSGVVFGLFYFLRTPRVETVVPRVMKAVQAVYASGSVEPVLEVPLSPVFTVRILEVHVDEGDTVKKDTLLSRFEFPEFEAQLDELVSREELAKKEFERTRILFDRSATSRELLDQTATALGVATASRKRFESLAINYSLRAPFDGTILRRDAEAGEIKMTSDILFWIASDDGLRVTAEVDEEDVPLLAPGQPVLLRADAYPEQVFEGHVTQITGRGDSVARTFRVRVGLADTTALKPGMSIEANIIIREEESALMLPHSSVRDGKVLLFQDGLFIPTSVETGIVGRNGIQILTGLPDGYEVARNWGDIVESDTRYRAVRSGWE
jgi:RND family efflux transporter MFP subunit